MPVLADSTCCIAASYEAKGYGIKTGTNVREARQRCPHLHVVEARVRIDVEYHHRVVEAVETCLHVDEISSIDEMYGRLMGVEQEPERAAAIAFQVKEAIRQAAGPCVRCSIGLAPKGKLTRKPLEGTRGSRYELTA